MTTAFLCLFALSSVAFSQDSTKGKAAHHDVFAPFIPGGWCLEKSVQGHLDRDTAADVAAVLLECAPRPAAGGDKRALLVMLGQAGERWRPLELLPGLLPCRSCLGTLGSNSESGIVLLIERRRVVVSWLRGSRKSVEVNIELGITEDGNGLVLLREDVERVDRVLGNETRRVRDFAAGVEIRNGVRRPLRGAPAPASTVRWDDY